MYSFILSHWLPIAIVMALFTLWMIYELRHPLRETFTMETETHLVVNGNGDLIETAEATFKTTV